MTASDTIASFSLIVSLIALITSCYPHIMEWKKTRRESIIYFKKLITSSQWTNEGDVRETPKTFFELIFLEVPGRSNIYAELKLNSGDEAMTIRGKINPDGTIKAILNITVGWRECPSAEIILKYDEDEDLLTYCFNHYLGNNGLNDNLTHVDFTTLLWRTSQEVSLPSFMNNSTNSI